jgi:hypothetical protein
MTTKNRTVVAYRNKQGRCFPATPILARFKLKMELEELYSMPVELNPNKKLPPKKQLIKDAREEVSSNNEEQEQLLQQAFAPKKK